MKIRLLLPFCLVLFVFGCQQSQSPEETPIEDSTDSTEIPEETVFESEGLVQYYNGDSITYRKVSFEKIHPTCDSADTDYCTSVKSNYLIFEPSDKLGGLNSMVSGDTSYTDFFKEYDEMLVDMEDQDFIPPWQTDENISVLVNTKDLLLIEFSSYSYLGGAHGISGISYLNYNPNTSAPYVLQDWFDEDNLQSVKSLGEKYFRLDNNLSTDESFSEAGYFDFNETKEFYLPETFALTEDGLAFIYQPYEIAAYAMGMPEFTIPLEDLKTLAREASVIHKL